MTLIRKEDGTTEPFDRNKLLDSLKRSGADPKIAQDITVHIEQTLEEGDTTHDIYEKAYTMLKELEWPSRAARYSLRRAILDLGPSGFPFEQFIAEIMAEKGYSTKRGVTLQGKCITHEIDVVAEKGNQDIFIEAKFHNSAGYKSDAKTALYIHARALDVEAADSRYKDTRQFAFWLMTNTKFTKSAITYGECAGLTMVGWNYPKKGNLQDLVEETKLHPVSCLSTLSKSQKKLLFDKDIVLCRMVRDDPETIDMLGIGGNEREKVLKEVEHLCTV